MQRAAIISITEDGVATLGRDGGGSAGQKGRLEVRPGGAVVWAPLTPGQTSAEVPSAVQGLAPGELPQAPPPAVGHAVGVGSTPGEAASPPAIETKAEEAAGGAPPAPGFATPGPDPTPAAA